MRSKPVVVSLRGSLIILTLATSGCAIFERGNVSSSGSCDLIPLVTYSEEFSAEFLRLWEQVPEGNALDVYLRDSMDLKDAVRDCRGKP
jgi:hypothetical protein